MCLLLKRGADQNAKDIDDKVRDYRWFLILSILTFWSIIVLRLATDLACVQVLLCL